jgi:prepilin-type N-terminal cleavage/methylation domain-containing protein
MQMKKKNIKLNKSGFTLIEILLSLAILFLIITGVVVFSVQTIEAHTKSRAMQNGIENARFAIEGLSKRIRTSHDIDDGGAPSSVKITDNVGLNKDYIYSFTGDRLVVNGETLVGGGNIEVSGSFSVQETIHDQGSNNRRGFVRISITVTYDGGDDVTESDSVTIQSGVSLRDYGEDGS